MYRVEAEEDIIVLQGSSTKLSARPTLSGIPSTRRSAPRWDKARLDLLVLPS